MKIKAADIAVAVLGFVLGGIVGAKTSDDPLGGFVVGAILGSCGFVILLACLGDDQ